MPKVSILVFIGLVVFQWANLEDANSATTLEEAFRHHLSNVQVKGTGTIVRILKDDTQGSKHQRFLIRLASEQSILIAHNIDLASRVSPIAVGDQVQFYAEYEWNTKGGVVHWTHRDPIRHHIGG
jgi:hypothetical protein